MAKVNLLNYGWKTNRQGSIEIDANSSYVEFVLGGGNTNKRAKACIAIDASKYKTITFSYSKVSHQGNTGLLFGVFDDMDPANTNGVIILNNADFNKSSGGSISKNISLSGTKYVGFWFFANSSGVGYCKEKPYITSLTATEKGYTLTYDANGGSGAPNAASDVTSTTISNIIPTRDNYEFLGWSKSKSASSASYVAGNSISLSSNLTLYAVWKKAICKISYDANGGSGSIEPQDVAIDIPVALCLNSFVAPVSPVWTLTLDGNGGNDGSPVFQKNYFNKWREGSTSGTSYAEGSSYAPSDDVTMYAWWGTQYIWGTTTRDSIYDEGYTVTFDANGGDCSESFLTSTIITSYDFLGWGNKASDPTSTFKSDAEYNQTSNYTAYAIWSSPITTNGSITLPTPTRNGYEFLGWSLDVYDTSGATGEYTPTDNVILYAIWKPMGLVYIYDGEFSQYQVWIYDDSGWNQYVPYIYTESGWTMYSG